MKPQGAPDRKQMRQTAEETEMTKGLLTPSRRSVLKGIAGTGALPATGFFPGYSHARSSEPITLGIELHLTCIHCTITPSSVR